MEPSTGLKKRHAFGRAWVLPHNCQLPDTFLWHFEEYMIFYGILNCFGCLIHAFSRKLCEPWLRYTGLAMSELRTTSICETARMSCHQVILHSGVLYPLTLCSKANACVRNLGFHWKGRLRPWCWRKHLYLRGKKNYEDGKNYTVNSLGCFTSLSDIIPFIK